MKAVTCNNPRAAELLTQMKTAMLIHYPFFASILLDQLELRVGKFPEIGMEKTTRSIYSGLRPQIDQIATKIMNDSANYVPINFHRVLKWFSYAVAYLTVIFGWICIAYLTVWICGRLLRLL